MTQRWPAVLLVVTALGTAPLHGTLQRKNAAPGQLQATQEQDRPSSYELIDAALDKDVIDDETAQRYRVFAAFGDSRLPPAYHGDDTELAGIPFSVMNLGSKLSTFSPQTRAELAPFFKPPNTPGSWIELPSINIEYEVPLPPRRGPNLEAGPEEDTEEQAPQERWSSVTVANGKVEIHWLERRPSDGVKARQLAQEVTLRIWPKLTGLFWEPKAEDGGTYDIFLNPYGGRQTSYWYGGVNSPEGETDCRNSSQIGMDPRSPVGGLQQKGMAQGVARFLMVAITNSVNVRLQDCSRYWWFGYATATWAEHYVYPDVQTEFRASRHYLSAPARSLDDEQKPSEVADGVYLFPFFLHLQGDTLALPAIWKRFEVEDGLDAVNTALGTRGKKLEDVFPRFAVHNWNRRVVGDYWRRDRMPYSAATAESIAVSLSPIGRYEHKITLGMPYLSSMYYYYQFDSTVKTVTFTNTTAPMRHSRVWGIPKIKGAWQQPVDWSRLNDKTWCRSNASEDLDELVLVFTNVQWKNTSLTVEPSIEPTVTMYGAGCDGWVGWDSVTATITGAGVTITDTVVATLEFDVDPALKLEGEAPEHWVLSTGYLQWKSSYSGRGCTGTGSGATLFLRKGTDEDPRLRIYSEGGTLRYSGTNAPWPDDPGPSYQVTCPNNHRLDQILMTQLYFATDPVRNEMAPDGKSFSGRFVMPGSAGSETRHVYSFRCRGC